jgi:hypothetical protein
MPERPRPPEEIPVAVPPEATNAGRGWSEDDSADYDPPVPGSRTSRSEASGTLPVRCTRSRPRSDVCVAHLAGELDIATVPVVAEYLRREAATRPAELLLDLSGVTHLAAAGLAGRDGAAAWSLLRPPFVEQGAQLADHATPPIQDVCVSIIWN